MASAGGVGVAAAGAAGVTTAGGAALATAGVVDVPVDGAAGVATGGVGVGVGVTVVLGTARVNTCLVLVQSALYRGLTVVARLRARPGGSAARLQEDALDALYGYLNPITGGPEGGGWPFGRPVHGGEVFAVLQSLRGVELVEDVRLFEADPMTRQRGGVVQRLELEPHALVYSYEHQVRVE